MAIKKSILQSGCKNILNVTIITYPEIRKPCVDILSKKVCTSTTHHLIHGGECQYGP